MPIQEGQIIYYVYFACLVHDIACENPLVDCKLCKPGYCRVHISSVVYTADKAPYLGERYFLHREDAEAKKTALEAILKAMEGNYSSGNCKC
jgi:hypothetical protein